MQKGSLNLKILHQNCSDNNPMGKDFNYAKEFESLGLEAVKRDVMEVMKESQNWWHADFGHCGPLLLSLTVRF